MKSREMTGDEGKRVLACVCRRSVCCGRGTLSAPLEALFSFLAASSFFRASAGGRETP